MAQYRFGKASLANGARLVTFVGAALAGNVQPGNLFSFQGENVWYEIVSVDEAAGTALLNSNYTGASKTDAAYAVHRDVTPALRMPILSYGDVNTAGLLQISLSTVDATMKTLGASGGALSGIASATLTLQRGLSGDPVENAGLIIERGNLESVSILWDELAELWTLGGRGLTGLSTLTASGKVTAGSFEATGGAVMGGNVTAPKFIGALQGNADSATRLATARSIALSGGATAAGVAFDGSAGITLDVTALDAAKLTAGTVPTARLSGSYNISVTGNAASATKWATARSVSVTGAATAAGVALDGSTDIALNVTALDATKLTGTIDAARLSGSYGISIGGNAATATKLAASRKISVGGDVVSTTTVTTNGDFDGSAAVTIDTQLRTIAGLAAGTYSNLTVDSKGRVTAIAALSKANVTTALGYTPLDANGGIVAGNLTVTGDLTVQGDTITLDVGTVSVEDAIITLAKNNAAATLPYAGLKAERGGSDAFWVFNESSDRWTAYTSGDDLATAGAKADIEAANVYGALKGNADTATKLANARSIAISGGATASPAVFDGTAGVQLVVTALDATKLTGVVPVASISITSDNVPEGQSLYFTTGRARASVSAAGTGLAYDPATGVFSSNATSANTNGAVVARDASGNFSAGTITAALQGNAASATKLATARTINGKSFDGTANVTLTTSNIAEGTNLYYTDSRATAAARAAIKPGAGITYDAATGTITNTAAASTVISVAGRAGDVTLTTADLTDLSTWKTANIDTPLGLKASNADLTSGLSGKLNLTGGTLSNNLTFSTDLTGVVLSQGGKLTDQNSSGMNNAGRTVLYANNNSFHIVSEDGFSAQLRLENGALTTAGAMTAAGNATILGNGGSPCLNLITQGSAFDANGRGWHIAARPTDYTTTAAEAGDLMIYNWDGTSYRNFVSFDSAAQTTNFASKVKIETNTSGVYPFQVVGGGGVNFGHVASFATVQAGTDAPRIHFIKMSVKDYSLGIDTADTNQFGLWRDASLGGNGTKIFAVHNNGNIYSLALGGWITDAFASKVDRHSWNQHDLLTGNYAYPQVRFYWPGVIHSGLLVDSDGSMTYRNADNGAIYYRFHPSGQFSGSGGWTLGSNGDLYMPWAGAWLSTIMGRINAQNIWTGLNYFDAGTYLRNARDTTTGNAANAWINGSTGLVSRSTSSIEYKRDVEDLWDEVGDQLFQMRPVWYRSTEETADNPDHSWYGLIAEELAKIDPRLVHWGRKRARDANGDLIPVPQFIPETDEAGNAVVDPETNEPKLRPNPEHVAFGQWKLEDKESPDGVQYERLTVLMINVLKRQRTELNALKANVAGVTPLVITDRQFYHGLAKRGIISMEEARAAVRTGDIPPAMQAIFDSEQFRSMLPAGMTMDDVYIMVEGALTYERHNLISELVAGFLGWTEAETDEFFTFCSTL